MAPILASGPWEGDRQFRDRCLYWIFVSVGIVLLVAAILFLRGMEHPWEGRTARRIARGNELWPEDYLRIYGYWTGVANVVVLALLLFTSKWWWRLAAGTGRAAVVDDGPRKAIPIPRWSWLGLAVILFAAAAIRAPQLNRYIMRDEQDNLRWTIHGYHELDAKTGEPVFHHVTWMEAFFGNRKGNNPILLSVSSKASLSLWQWATGTDEEIFSPVALRLPVILAGLASIAAIWWSVGLLGFPSAHRAALIAAALAAAHPMHIEYSVEARGYAFVMLGAALAMGFTVNALRKGRWRDWAGLGLSFMMILYSFLGGIYFVSTLAGSLAVYLFYRLWKPSEGGAPQAALVRYLIVGIVALGVYAQLSLPATVQIFNDWGLAHWRNPLGAAWLFSAYTEMTTGAVFHEEVAAMRETGGIKGILNMFAKMTPVEPFYVTLVFVVVPLVALSGFIRCWRCGPAARLVMVAALAAPVVMYSCHRFVSHQILMIWYLIYALPALLILLGVGLDVSGASLAGALRRLEKSGASSARRWLPGLALPAVSVLFFAWFIWQTGPWYYYRNPQETGPRYPYVSYTRGAHNWVVYPNGVNACFPVDEEIPMEFPWDLPVERIKDGIIGGGHMRGVHAALRGD